MLKKHLGNEISSVSLTGSIEDRRGNHLVSSEFYAYRDKYLYSILVQKLVVLDIIVLNVERGVVIVHVKNDWQ